MRDRQRAILGRYADRQARQARAQRVDPGQGGGAGRIQVQVQGRRVAVGGVQRAGEEARVFREVGVVAGGKHYRPGVVRQRLEHAQLRQQRQFAREPVRARRQGVETQRPVGQGAEPVGAGHVGQRGHQRQSLASRTGNQRVQMGQAGRVVTAARLDEAGDRAQGGVPGEQIGMVGHEGVHVFQQVHAVQQLDGIDEVFIAAVQPEDAPECAAHAFGEAFRNDVVAVAVVRVGAGVGLQDGEQHQAQGAVVPGGKRRVRDLLQQFRQLKRVDVVGADHPLGQFARHVAQVGKGEITGKGVAVVLVQAAQARQPGGARRIVGDAGWRHANEIRLERREWGEAGPLGNAPCLCAIVRPGPSGRSKKCFSQDKYTPASCAVREKARRWSVHD